MSSHSIAIYRQTTVASLVAKIAPLGLAFDVIGRGSKIREHRQVLIFDGREASALWIRQLSDLPWQVYQALGEKSGCIWLHLLFQEKVVWEYNLYRGAQLLDQFVPRPEIWGCEKRPGNAAVLAEAWGIKSSRIEKYLRQWTRELVGKKAYRWRDRYRYGNFEQGYDFLFSLTGIRT